MIIRTLGLDGLIYLMQMLDGCDYEDRLRGDRWSSPPARKDKRRTDNVIHSPPSG